MTHKGVPIRITANLSIETLQARREWQDILKVMKENNLQPRLLYPARISFRDEREFKSFWVSRSVCPALCDPTNHSTPVLPVHHQLPEFTQTHAHWVGDAIQLSHPLFPPSPPAPHPSQHQDLFQWVNSSNEVTKVPEFQLQHQSF